MLKRRVTDKQLSNARQLRRDMTEAERKLWRLLRSRRLAHVKFRRQVPLGPWVADFVTFEHKVIVEADGSQHAESERDKARDLDLAARGFRVFRFWNNDILARPEAVLEQIFAPCTPPLTRPRFARAPSPSRSRIYPTSANY